jgi:hypothetical protein
MDRGRTVKGNTTSGTRRLAAHAQRLAWLTTHPDLLGRLPGTKNDVDPAQSEALDEALRHMKLLRLYAPTAAAEHVRWGIRRLVDELRAAAATVAAASAADPRRI